MDVIRYEQLNPDDPVFILVECSGKPSINLDITSMHGRRTLGVRVDGMGIFGCLLDIIHLEPDSPGRVIRFCPFCGKPIALVSSQSHICDA